MATFNIVLAGDAGIGKTSLLKRLTGDFEKMYIPTSGVKSIKVMDMLNVWDCAGQEMGFRHNMARPQGAIVMFDVTSNISYKNARLWVNRIRSLFGSIPIVLCGNKVDVKNGNNFAITLHKELDLPYFSTSAKSKFNIEMPFMYLMEKLDA